MLQLIKIGGSIWHQCNLLVPLGTGAQIRVQPAYSIAVYKMDMDNLPVILPRPQSQCANRVQNQRTFYRG